MPRAHAMIRDFTALLVRLVTGVHRLNEPAHDGPPRIYFANHSSHLDFVVIWAALPRHFRKRVRPVAAADYWEKGALRRWLAKRVFHAVLIPRGKICKDDDPIGKMAEAMDDGCDLILFPEGTRSEDGRVGEFRSGIHALARQHPHMELIPVYLENLNRILPKGEFLVVPLIGTVVFGPACEAPGEDESRHDFLARIRDSVLALSTHHDTA